jgi:hypothetical protein
MREDPESVLQRVARELKEPVRIDRSFDDRVMAAVRLMPRHRFGTWLRVLRPRTVTFSPVVSGLAAAALFVVALSMGHALGVGGALGDAGNESLNGTSSRVAAGNLSPRDVQFVLVAPNARKVAVVGDFNDWDSEHAAYQAEHRGGGVWSVTAPVPVGHHRYSFVVDDSLWVTDPTAPRMLDEDYGRPNSALVVGESAP